MSTQEAEVEGHGRHGYSSPWRGSLAPLLVLLVATAWPATVRADESDAPRARTSRAEAIQGPAIAAREAYLAHEALFTEENFPSAVKCAACHERHYREWSVSGHAYAQISPIFNSMQATLNLLANGTLGDFCIRCHTPQGMAIGEPVFASNLDRSSIAVEGITCVACHRVDRAYGKVSGRFALVPGDIFAPVYGPRDDTELRRVLDSPDEYKRLVTEPGRSGRKIHAEARQFFQITTPGFCGRCHDVRFIDGFRLEDAFSEYKQSPAARRGETCQDCHMGIEPGHASGYETAPAAVIRGVPTTPAKHTNHMLSGPDYSVVHPGIFPQNPEAMELATPLEWESFDHAAGWGTDEFEDDVDEDAVFPERWEWPDDRYEAREIIDTQLALLSESRDRANAMLRRGYRLGEVRVKRADAGGVEFHVELASGTDGHNVPTGFASERMVFLQVTVTDAAGVVVFRSGDLDPNGDVRDLHSSYVHDGKLPLDRSLVNLQSPFVTRNLRGGEQEQIIPTNLSIDPLPFSRPATTPSLLLGGTPAARIHKQNIAPGGRRWGRYKIDADALTGSDSYRINVKLIAGMLPVNLVNAVSGVGFDYGLSPRKIADRVVAGHKVLWERDVDLEIER